MEGGAARRWSPAATTYRRREANRPVSTGHGSQFEAPSPTTHLDLGADVRGAALRSFPDLSLVLGRGGRARRSAQHGAGRQLGVRLSVRLRAFGEAKWRRLSQAGFGSHHQDGWREDRDWDSKRKERLLRNLDLQER